MRLVILKIKCLSIDRLCITFRKHYCYFLNVWVHLWNIPTFGTLKRLYIAERGILNLRKITAGQLNQSDVSVHVRGSVCRGYIETDTEGRGRAVCGGAEGQQTSPCCAVMLTTAVCDGQHRLSLTTPTWDECVCVYKTSTWCWWKFSFI